MDRTVSDPYLRTGEWMGDLTAWARENGPDNSERLARLRRQLRAARERELTPRQRLYLELYFEGGLTVKEIAQAAGVNPSTVSRTLRRAKTRLRRALQYAL